MREINGTESYGLPIKQTVKYSNALDLLNFCMGKILDRELKRLNRVYYCTLTLAVITILSGVITYINSIWSV